MLRKSFVWGLALMALAALPAAAEEEGGQTLEEVLAMNLEARGGADALAAVNTVRANGKMTMGEGMEAPFVWEWKRPDKVRLQFTVQGQTAVQAYDGESGWQLMPFLGKTDPVRMSAEETKQAAEMADFEGPLVRPEDKGYTLEYLGTEEIEGTPAHKIKATDEDGDVTYLFLDADYGLEIKQTGKRTVRDQEIEFEMEIGDYKEVGDLVLPHSREAKAAGAPGGQVITVDSFEINPDIPDSTFAMPPPAEAPEGEEGEGGAG